MAKEKEYLRYCLSYYQLDSALTRTYWSSGGIAGRTHDSLPPPYKRIYHIRACKKAYLPDEVGLTTYTTKIRPLLEYAFPILGGIPDYLSLELQRVQDRCLKILGLPKDALETLASRRSNLTKKELERMMRSDTFKHLFKQSDHSYNLRHKKYNQVPLSRRVRHQQSFVPRALRL